jgi:hypothetical protein
LIDCLDLPATHKNVYSPICLLYTLTAGKWQLENVSKEFLKIQHQQIPKRLKVFEFYLMAKSL